ncbi:unnamed protein product, partial [Brachionus calyciflorus]
QSLEQIIKISDSLIYAEVCDVYKSEFRSKPIKFNGLDNPISSFNDQNAHSFDNFDNFERIFSFVSDKDDFDDESEVNLEMCIDIWFKIEKLQIDFLADVERPGQ